MIIMIINLKTALIQQRKCKHPDNTTWNPFVLQFLASELNRIIDYSLDIHITERV